MKQKAFPPSWPQDCPPSTAVAASGIVFRLVRHNPPRPADFVTHFEAGKLPQAPECLRRGLSLFRSFDDAEHQRRLFPKLGNAIASATLESHHGVVLSTPTRLPSHTTWWVYEGVDRASLFHINPAQ